MTNKLKDEGSAAGVIAPKTLAAYASVVMAQKVLVVGGGFGGVRLAQRLAKNPDFAVTVVSPRSWLEYYGALYRIIRSDAFSRVCVPLSEMLPKSVTTMIDAIESVDTTKKTAQGRLGSYAYDILVLAPGAEPAYFGIPGMKENALTMGHVGEAVHLRRHFDALLTNHLTLSQHQKETSERVLVIGGGPTGVETAAELVVHLEDLRKRPPHIILIEAADRILPSMPEIVSKRSHARLEKIGVQVMVGKKVTGCLPGTLQLADSEIEAGTIVWTAGVKANSLLAKVTGLQLDPKGRALVDGELRAQGVQNVFVLGDCAKTQYAGMAQTAIYDADFVAKILSGRPRTYAAPKPKFALPIGERWAAVVFGPLNVFGLLGYAMRLAADLKVFLALTHPVAAAKHFFGIKNAKWEEEIRATLS